MMSQRSESGLTVRVPSPSVAVGHGDVYFFSSAPFFVTLCVILHSVLPAKVRASIFLWLNVKYDINQDLVSEIQ